VVRWQRLLITVVMTMTMATPPMPVQPHLRFGIGAILIRGITPRYPNARFRGDKWFSSGRGIPINGRAARALKARRVLQSPRPAPNASHARLIASTATRFALMSSCGNAWSKESPATKQIVGEHNLPSLIEQFDPDILAEVLQLDLRSRTAVEAPDFV
jgi:hypothetical protein